MCACQLTTLDIIESAVTILSLAVSAIALFVYTQRDKKSYLRININSNKLQFSVDLENIGPSPARIKEIRLEKRKISDKKVKKVKKVREESLITLFGAKNYKKSNSSAWSAESIMFANVSGDVITGGGIKHHLFSCYASNVDSLKYLWETLKDYDMVITYYDVYGMFFWLKRKCKSHFQQDYKSFEAAVGNRTSFSDKICHD